MEDDTTKDNLRSIRSWREPPCPLRGDLSAEIGPALDRQEIQAGRCSSPRVERPNSLLVFGLLLHSGISKSRRNIASHSRAVTFSTARNSKMDQRDREPLDRSSGRIQPTPHSDGTLALSAIALFLAG